MTSILHSPVHTDHGDSTEVTAAADDRDVLMINGTAFDLS